jgi:hypothetical protein
MWAVPSRFRVDKFGQGDRAEQLIPLPWPFALLCWNTHMHLWLSANTATSEDNNRSGRHQQSTKTNKPIFFPLLA